MTFTLKYEHVSAAEGAPDGSSEGCWNQRWYYGYTWSYNWVALEDTHGGALVSAKEFT